MRKEIATLPAVARNDKEKETNKPYAKRNNENNERLQFLLIGLA